MKLKFGLIFMIVVLFLIGYPIAYYMSKDTVTITVKDKERIVTTDNKTVNSKFLVYTTNEVFENTDSYLYFKFNSSNIQNKLDRGKTYHVIVAGWRIPFFSTYRNIIKIDK